MSTATITTWLLTYLIHSTVLLGSAWLVTRLLGDRRLALQEILLRTALLGGLLTATLQIGFNVEPVGGSLAITDISPAEVVATNGSAAASVPAGESTLSPSRAAHSPLSGIWPMALISLWMLGSMLALLVLGRSVLDLRRLLKTRRFRPTGRLLERLSVAMGLRKPVRLSTSSTIAVPFATGIKRPEICCPERVGDLAFEHQKSLFAHELAHLARRDPAWQLLYRLGEAFLFLQPLNRLVRRRLEEIAEHLTDERAVACTGDRLGLAQCLVVVAHWGVSNSPGVPATAFASGPRLDRRVRHLISGAVGQHHNARWTAPLLIALVLGSVALLPAIAPSEVHADISPTGSDTVPVQTWSTSASDPEAEVPAAPAAPAVPRSSDVPRPVAPVTDVSPAHDVVPLSSADPRPVSAPAPPVEPSPATAPDSPSVPAPPSPPTPSAPSPAEIEKAASEERKKARDEARARQREARRERLEAEKEARERAHAFARQAREAARETAELSRLTDAERKKLREEAREHSRHAAERLRLTEAEREEMRRRVAELHAESRELAREAGERLRWTEAQREKYWEETRELRRRAEVQAREYSRRASEQLRCTEAQREDMRRRAEELHAESRELAREAARTSRARARELAERARRLAEEAESERQIEEKRRQHDRKEE